MKKIFSPIILLVALALPWRSFAATVTVGPSERDPQTVTIVIDTQGKNVNAIELHLSFDADLFSIRSVSDGGSVVNDWVSGPTFSNAAGTLDLAGIIPGGESTAEGTIITIALIPKQPEVKTSFIFDSGQVLLNDGKGTPAALSIILNPFELTGEGSAQPQASTKEPNAFTPQIGQSADIFDGHYFLAFSTTDQRSGIDHYEVLEVPAGTKATSSLPWTVATSPYLLKDQTLSSDVYVRAVDTAGNFRVEEIPAMHMSSASSAEWRTTEAVLGLIVLLLIIVGIWRRIGKWKKRKRSRNSG